MTAPNAHVPEPVLSLTDGTPVSQAFGDVYFSRDGGVEETAHVFLRGNGVPERWAGRDRFTIGELGFGTGLNFLVAWKQWKETAPAGAILHYISIEKFPFKLADLRRILALQPEVREEAEALLAAYPLRLPGLHRIHLPGVMLTLCFGDVAEMLTEWNMAVDAWFLDGFSPAKNPEMWSDDVLSQLNRLSAPGATCATFTSAGAVRRSLEAAGFAVTKVPGYGHKREMSVGVISRNDEGASRSGASPHQHPHPTLSLSEGEGSLAVPLAPEKRILVLGAGIAGATLARALAERGMQVTVLERTAPGSGASGNKAGVLFPQLSKRWNRSTDWYFTAYGFMLRQLRQWQGLPFMQKQIGMLRLPRHAEEEAQLRSLQHSLGLDSDIVHWVERDVASAQAGLELKTGGAYFPQGTAISPPELCKALLQHANISCCNGVAAQAITKTSDGWQVTLTSGEVMQADIMCVATATESAELLVEYGIRLNAVGGQVSEIAAADVAGELRSILCHKGYVIPLGESYLTGATYHREGDPLAVTDAHHQENLAELANVLPGWCNGHVVSGRSALRATTPDRLPYIGKLDEGLYVSTGHGSRGMLSAPLAAEMIASEIAGEQSPVSTALRAALLPSRFGSK